jgi:hypothetical protein
MHGHKARSRRVSPRYRISARDTAIRNLLMVDQAQHKRSFRSGGAVLALIAIDLVLGFLHL